MNQQKIINNLKKKSEPKFVDLHLHTTISDGLLSPEELVKIAYRMKYKILSITDHDSLSGIQRARAAAENYGIEIISGCELTGYYGGYEIHILAYFVEPDNKIFNKYLKKFKNARFNRARTMVEKLNRINININFDEMQKKIESEALGRPHIAREIVDKGYEKDVQTVFKKYLIPGAPAYVSKFLISPEDVIKIILKAGGVPVFAHPYYYFNFEGIIQKLIIHGLKGIEVYHSFHTASLVRKFKKIADKYNLVITGGSDAHSGPKGDYLPFGSVALNKNIVKKLRLERESIKEELQKSVLAS